jgi:hypothetical protein
MGSSLSPQAVCLISDWPQDACRSCGMLHSSGRFENPCRYTMKQFWNFRPVRLRCDLRDVYPCSPAFRVFFAPLPCTSILFSGVVMIGSSITCDRSAVAHRLEALLAITVFLCPALVVPGLPAAFGQPAEKADSRVPTFAEALKVLDLTQFPLVNPVGNPNSVVPAGQSYLAMGSVVDVAKQLIQQFQKEQWKELPGVMITEAYASGNLTKQGYIVSLGVFPGSEAGTATVNIRNHGNLVLKNLPLPAGVQPLYAVDISGAWTTDSSVADTEAKCRKVLAADGWTAYGDVVGGFFVRKNAMLLSVSVSESPAQQGKTVIQMNPSLMSIDLPVPENAERIQYADGARSITWETPSDLPAVVEFLKTSLAPQEWKATTENAIAIDFRDHLIFRNPEGDLLEAEMDEVDGKTTVFVHFSTAAEVARLDASAKEQAAKMKQKQEQENRNITVIVALPKGAKIDSQDDQEIELITATGGAKKVADQLVRYFTEREWTSEVLASEKQLGEITLKKDDLTLQISWVDPGFIDGSVTLSASGRIVLEQEKQPKSKSPKSR